jgi:hypothetical protein
MSAHLMARLQHLERLHHLFDISDTGLRLPGLIVDRVLCTSVKLKQLTWLTSIFGYNEYEIQVGAGEI